MDSVSSFFRDIIVKAKFVSVDKEEERFKTTLNRSIQEWKKQVLKKLDKEIAKSLISKALDDLDPSEIEAIANFNVGSMPKRLTSLAGVAAQKGLERAYKDMKMMLSWNIDMTPVADFYLSHYDEFSKILSSDMQARVKQLIAQAIKDGTPSTEVHQQIASIFDGPVVIKVPEKLDEEGKVARRGYEYTMDKDRYTTMVARTEIQRALNNGRVYGYQQSNIAKTLKWVANPGACEFCMPHNGEEYSVEDSQDLIPLHPNCRCTWVVSEYKKFEEETEGLDKFADPESIYSDADGVHIMDFFKLNESQFKDVNKMIDNGDVDQALKLLRGEK